MLLHFEQGVQIIHLGMSGSLRRVDLDEERRKHDHAEWIFDEARFLLRRLQHDPELQACQERWALLGLWLIPALWAVNFIVARWAPGVVARPVAAVTSAAISSNFARTASASSG